MSHRKLTPAALLALVVVLTLTIPSVATNDSSAKGEWIAVDFHQHTTYTDGSNSMKTLMYKNKQFGLGWWANSEHGGAFGSDARGPLTIDGPFNVNGGAAWSTYPSGTVIGTPPAGRMWRWQSIRDFSFWDVIEARATFLLPIVQGLEWNVPGHEHCSVGLFANQFDYADLNASPMAEFEYLFDADDSDVAGGLAQGWGGKNTTNNHAKAVAAAAWLQQYYPKASWMVPAHVERKGVGNPTYVGSGSYGYNISDFRDLNNAAPDVCFGFESMPGHQKESGRGGYGSGAVGGGTFGGTGYYSAVVGGLWDALLAEGRHWWLFASSDFHNTNNDFWPGEYQKTWVKVADRMNPQSIVDGLRSGNSFVVEGDLIDGLDFSIGHSGMLGFMKDVATMGESLKAEKSKYGKQNVKIIIRFKSPAKNNNGDRPVVDHIDLIAGNIRGLVAPGNGDYNNPNNPTTEVIATFFRRDFKLGLDGWYTAGCEMKLETDCYFRLRGSNMPRNTPNQTDAAGNPLPDTLAGPNTAQEAYKDLWFYSNPIFVYVK